MSYNLKAGEHGTGVAEPIMIVGYIILMAFSLTIAIIKFVALYKFYHLVKSLPKSFVLNRGPIFVNALSIFCWTVATLVEMVYLLTYYSDWSSYENVCSVLAVSDFCFVLNAGMFTVLAYQLVKMSGIQFCRRKSRRGYSAQAQ